MYAARRTVHPSRQNRMFATRSRTYGFGGAVASTVRRDSPAADGVGWCRQAGGCRIVSRLLRVAGDGALGLASGVPGRDRPGTPQRPTRLANPAAPGAGRTQALSTGGVTLGPRLNSPQNHHVSEGPTTGPQVQ